MSMLLTLMGVGVMPFSEHALYKSTLLPLRGWEEDVDGEEMGWEGMMIG